MREENSPEETKRQQEEQDTARFLKELAHAANVLAESAPSKFACQHKEDAKPPEHDQNFLMTTYEAAKNANYGNTANRSKYHGLLCLMQLAEFGLLINANCDTKGEAIPSPQQRHRERRRFLARLKYLDRHLTWKQKLERIITRRRELPWRTGCQVLLRLAQEKRAGGP